jgi:hypothetical protein
MRKASSKWAASVSDLPYAKMIEDFQGHSPYPAGDVADWVNGSTFSGNTIGSAIITMGMRTLGLDMPIPFFIVQGRDDHITGFEPARLYAEDVRAPKKASCRWRKGITSASPTQARSLCPTRTGPPHSDLTLTKYCDKCSRIELSLWFGGVAGIRITWKSAFGLEADIQIVATTLELSRLDNSANFPRKIKGQKWPLVRAEGREPPCLAAFGPKPRASTSSGE